MTSSPAITMHTDAMTRRLIALALLPALLALTACSRGPRNEDQAVELLSRQVIADKPYPASQNGACLAFQVEQASQNRYEIAVREKHGEGCPGDPGTGPVIDRFEVVDNGKLRLYDPVAGNYADYVPGERAAKP